MADKFLTLVNGERLRVSPLSMSTGVADANRIVSTGNDGFLDPSLFPNGFGPDLLVLPAFENIEAGRFVYIRNDAGVAKAAKASADVGGIGADGFVLQGATAGQNITVYFEGKNTSLTGLTVGTRYYLSDTVPGGVTATPVDGAGKLHQYLGRSVSTTTIAFEADDIIRLNA